MANTDTAAMLDGLAQVMALDAFATAAPMKWTAHKGISPEEVIAAMAETATRTVEDGCFSGELHKIEEAESGRTVAFTGCGPRGGDSAQLLIACAHFLLQHGADVAALAGQADAEPVAWRWRYPDGEVGMTWWDMDDTDHMQRMVSGGAEIEYAYTTPPAAIPVDALREAASELVELSLNFATCIPFLPVVAGQKNIRKMCDRLNEIAKLIAGATP